ncbi:MAG: iron-dicitrate transporter substrate-binding subunit [Methanosaeta sp. PtaU1.Bin112]|nr:MAG: iron-dicitrate transporter substrate-binding subunit [Methanosaeta sp. PtaU1.Bin112]
MKGLTLVSVMLICILANHMPAMASEFVLEVFGNANMDDVIDQTDIEYAKAIINKTTESSKLADANLDGKVDEADIAQIRSIISKDEKQLGIVDSSGRSVLVPRPVNRIVSLSIDDLRVLAELGAVDNIVGRPEYVDKYADKLIPLQAHPEIKDIPSAGGYKTPNIEIMLSLKPDVIFAYGGSSAYTDIADDIQYKTNIPVVCIHHSTDSGYKFDLNAFRLVGIVVGKEDRAEELIAYAEKEIAELSEKTSKIPESEKPRVYFFSAHEADFIENAVPCYGPIDVAGGINVARELPSCTVADISIEQIIDWNPDIILIHSFSKEPAISVEAVLSDPRLQSIKAVKTGKVYYTKGFYIGWDPASGIAESFYLAKLLHPEAFKDLDVEEKGNEILKQFYGADGLYTWTLDSVGNYYRWN